MRITNGVVYTSAETYRNLASKWINTAQQEIRAQELKIQALTMELGHLRRIRFGKKSESLTSVQPSLFEESVLADIAAVDAEIEQIDATAKTTATKLQRARAGRQPLPDHLPRIEYRHEPESCQCNQCGRDLVKIGEDVTEQLDVEPARFFVHRIPPTPPPTHIPSTMLQYPPVRAAAIYQSDC